MKTKNKMEIQIKKAIRAGNSSAVVLPKAWLNKEVRVELFKKSEETILFESLKIIGKSVPLNEVIGVYLAGSYARGEENDESDIDILAVTENTDKKMIYEGIYSILIVSKELLNQKLKEDLLPIGQMIKESKPLINSDYLNSIKLDVTKNNIKWHLETTKEKIKLIERALKTIKEKNIKIADSRITYTLILRIRTLEIIKKLLKNEIYSNKEFVKLIKEISKSSALYESYLEIKNNLPKKSHPKIEENELLLGYLKKILKEVERKVKS